MGHEWWRVLAAAMVLAGAAVTEVSAEDTAVSIEQIPKEKQLERDALDKDLLPEGVPPRCADPDVAVRDPACIHDRALEDFSRSLGLPLIDDPAHDRSPLVPGVTVNQPRRKALP